MTTEGTWNEVWEALFTSRAWGRYPPEAVVAEVSRSFRADRIDRRTVRALDLGCGPGAVTWFLAREAFDVTGIDGSRAAIDQCRARLAGEGLQAELVCGDFTAPLPFPDASFDLVVDVASLCANPMRAIARAVGEVRRVLKDGGLFVSLLFTDRTWGAETGVSGDDRNGFQRIVDGPLADKGYVQLFDRAQVEELVRDFATHRLERTSVTAENMTRVIEHWLVVARR